MNSKSPTQEILDAVRRIVQGLRISSRIAEKRLGISGAQLFVLQTLSHKDGLSINELATRTQTHQSSVSVVVSRLEEARLVTRIPSSTDARQKLLSLTPAGRKLLKKVPPSTQERLIQALESFPPRQRAELARLLDRLVRESGLSERRPTLFFEEMPEDDEQER